MLRHVIRVLEQARQRRAWFGDSPRRVLLPQRKVEIGEGTTEVVELVFLSGWAPAPTQPAPARRGSGTASLADALKPKS